VAQAISNYSILDRMMRKPTSVFLCLVLASAVVHCEALALDRESPKAFSRRPRRVGAGSYLDCSLEEKHVQEWLENGSFWQNRWECSDVQLAIWLNQTRGVPTIVCIGDSNTRGLGLEKKFRKWAKWHLPAFPMHMYKSIQFREQYNVVNLGVAGASAQRGKAVSFWSLPQWKNVLPALSNVAAVVVQLGTNDAKLGAWNKTAFRDDYIMMLQNITDMHPHASIITSIPPPVDAGASDYAKDYVYVNNELGTEITAATNAAHLSAPHKVINMQDVFTGHDAVALKDAAAEDGQRGLLQDDGVHVSTAGHNLMSDTFAKAIKHGMKSG